MRVGRYEIIRPIATGGMATVYLGRARGAAGFERQVAIKMMHPHLAANPDYVTMFLDEARMAANLRHPNVVPTLDVVQVDSKLLLVMEYVDGLPLNEVVKALSREGRKVPIGVAIRIVLDLLGGLGAAHTLTDEDGKPMRLVHRDVSPQNLLVGDSGTARLMDFGIARADIRVFSTGDSGSIRGKLRYMAPEQLAGKEVDARSDLYSAAVVLWELLTGEPLVTGNNEVDLFHSALKGERAPPSKLNPKVPRRLDKVCLRALSRVASKRFTTAADFAEALEIAALESNVRIAMNRGVAQLLASLPQPPQQRVKRLEGDIATVTARTPTGSHVAARLAEAEEAPGARSPDEPAGIAEGREEPPASAHASTVTGELGQSLSWRPPPMPRPRVLLTTALGALLLGGASWFFLQGDTPADPPPASAATSAATAPATPATASTTAAPSTTRAPTTATAGGDSAPLTTATPSTPTGSTTSSAAATATATASATPPTMPHPKAPPAQPRPKPPKVKKPFRAEEP